MTTMPTANRLDRESFDALRNEEIGAILIDNLIGEEECRKVCMAVRALTERSTYRWNADLSIIGVSIGEAHESPDLFERYLDEAPQTPRIIRDVVFGGPSPADRITLEMLGIWPAGIRIPSSGGRYFLSQVMRRWKLGGGAHPHIDQSNTALLAPFGIRRRFGLNVYLEMPSEGGAVEFWDRYLSDGDYARLRQPPPDYGLSRTEVGPADLVIRPRRGQAILFDASKPHAVEPVGGVGERITIATFYGHVGDSDALLQFA